MKIFVERMGINCEGIGKIPDGENKDKLIFIPGAIDGELVSVKIASEKKNYCTGVLDGIISQSSDRCESQCPYFSVCGGCDIQHITLNKQNIIKTNIVSQNIKKISNIDVDCKNIIRVNDYSYRNKMVFPIKVIDGNLQIGMYEKQSHKIVNIDRCLLTSDIINTIFKLSKKYFVEYANNEINKNLKYLVIRNYSSEVLITIVTEKKIDLKGYFEYIKSNYCDIGVSQIVSDNKNDILSGKYYYIGGLEHLTINEFGIVYKVDNRGFLQVNNDIKKLIYENILNEIGCCDNVVDAYGGAGLLTAIISKKACFVTGIEINKSASDSAKALIKENNITNAKFICGDVKDYIEKSIKQDTVVILDPPRAGCDKAVISSIINNSEKIKKIIYLSCDHATLARDLKLLNEKYQIIFVFFHQPKLNPKQQKS